MPATKRADHSDAYIAAMRRAAETEAQGCAAAAANAEQFAERQAARRQRLNAARQHLDAAIAWCRANPKPVLIAAACAPAFNFVLYPVSHYAGACDRLPTGTAVVLCHLEHSDTFVGSWLR